jgi:histidine triad (HIT) family protein
VKKIAQRIKDELNTAGLNIVQNNGKMAGQLVNHIHFHVIPRYAGDQVIITYQRTQMDDAQMEEIKKKLTEDAQPTAALSPKDLDLDF